MKNVFILCSLIFMSYHASSQHHGSFLLWNNSGRTYWNSGLEKFGDGFVCTGYWLDIHPDDSPTLSVLNIDHAGNIVWTRDLWRVQYGYPTLHPLSVNFKKEIFTTVSNQIYLLDSTGHVKWKKRIYGAGGFYNIHSLSDGGAIVTGLTYTSTNVGETHLLKFDSAGNLEWNKKFQVGTYNMVRNVFQMDSTLIISGSFTDTSNVNRTYISEFDMTGNVLSIRGFTNSESLQEMVYDVNSGNFYYVSSGSQYTVIGKIDSQYNSIWTKSISGIGLIKISQENDSIFVFGDSTMIALDTSGAFLFKFFYPKNILTGAEVNKGVMFTIHHDGKCSIFDIQSWPMCSMYSGMDSVTNLSVAQMIPQVHTYSVSVLDSGFNYSASSTYSLISQCIQTKITQLDETQAFTIYPTIATTNISIMNNSSQIENAIVKIIDLTGRVLLQNEVFPHIHLAEEIKIDELKPGGYILYIETESLAKHSFLFIKE
jgi:hypothetical protein